MSASNDLRSGLAHDLRSPISALNVILETTPQMSKESRELLKAVIDRLQIMADDLDKAKSKPDGYSS